jgi:hypothetical protein
MKIFGGFAMCKSSSAPITGGLIPSLSCRSEIDLEKVCFLSWQNLMQQTLLGAVIDKRWNKVFSIILLIGDCYL